MDSPCCEERYILYYTWVENFFTEFENIFTGWMMVCVIAFRWGIFYLFYMVYTEVTDGYLVEAEPTYVPEHSHPDEHQFFFAYRIRITNQGGKKAQLHRRHWIITDGNQNREEVEGEGVVGEQPSFDDGTSYEYTSFCPLTTPTGNMRGSYIMTDENGKSFQIKIPLFFLRDHSHNH